MEGKEAVSYDNDFAYVLYALRKQAKLTQRELAERAGVDFSYISKLENGRLEPPSEEVIIKIAEAVGTNRYYLILTAGKVPSDFSEVILRHSDVQEIIMAKMKEEKK